MKHNHDTVTQRLGATCVGLISACTLIGGILLYPSTVIADPILTDYPIPASPAAEGDAYRIFTGSSGTVWLIDTTGHVGLVAPDGQVTEHAVAGLPSPSYGDSFEAAVDSAGNFWVSTGSEIVRVTPGGQQSRHVPSHVVMGIIAASSDGVWFSGQGTIGRITSAGQLSEYPVATDSPAHLSLATDGALWYAGGTNSSPKIGRVTAAASPQEFTVTMRVRLFVPVGPSSMWVPTDNYEFVGEVRAADGSVTSNGVELPDSGRTTDRQGNRWWRILSSPMLAHKTPAGVTTSFQTDYSYQQLLAAADEGIWSTDGWRKAAKIVADDTAPNKARLTEYPLPASAPGLVGLGADPVQAVDGGFWSVRPDGVLLRVKDDGLSTLFPVPTTRRVRAIPDDQGGLWFAGASASIGRVAANGTFGQWVTPHQPLAFTTVPGSGTWYVGATAQPPIRPRVGHVTASGVITEFNVDSLYDGSVPYQGTAAVAGLDGRVWWFAGRQLFATSIGGTSMVMYTAPAGETIHSLAVSGDRVWARTFVGLNQGRYVSVGSNGSFSESALVTAAGDMFARGDGSIWALRGGLEGSPAGAYPYSANAQPGTRAAIDVSSVVGSTPAGGLVVRGDTGSGEGAYLVRTCGITAWPNVRKVVTASDGRVWGLADDALTQLSPQGAIQSVTVAGLQSSARVLAASDNALWTVTPGHLSRMDTSSLGSSQSFDWASCGVSPPVTPSATPDPVTTPEPSLPSALTEPSTGATESVQTAPGTVAKVRQSRRGTLLRVTWPSVPGATSYRVRLSKPGGKKYLAWKIVAKPAFKASVKKRRTYRLQVVAVGPGGQGPVRTFKVSK